LLIKDLIDYMKVSELNQISYVNSYEGNDSKKDALIALINLGLIELHKRFPLKIEDWTFTAGNELYYRTPNDFMYIRDAYNITKDIPLKVNSEEECLNVYTPYMNRIAVSSDLRGDEISIVYSASPEKVETIDDDIEFPSYLIDCLSLFIGYKAHNSVNSSNNVDSNDHDIFFRRYIKACQDIEELGIYTRDSLESHKFKQRGFV
jgi:hypothetical protein